MYILLKIFKFYLYIFVVRVVYNCLGEWLYVKHTYFGLELQMCSYYKESTEVLQKLKIELPYDSDPTFEYKSKVTESQIPKDIDICRCVHYRTIHNANI